MSLSVMNFNELEVAKNRDPQRAPTMFAELNAPTSLPRCAMRGTCGKKGGIFGRDLPCPYDGEPVQPTSREVDVLNSICPSLHDPNLLGTCCTEPQLDELSSNFAQVEAILGPCPACRNNFRAFFCEFTCSPYQSQFVNITSTQQTSTGQEGVKSLDFYVGERFKNGFWDSCKDVKLGSAGQFVMDFIFGGAKSAGDFLKYLGDEKDLGSPFQINFPESPETNSSLIQPLNESPRSCSDLSDLSSRCSCIDCASVCPALPVIPPPSQCTIGNPSLFGHTLPITCLSFSLVLSYALIAIIGFAIGFILHRRSRKQKSLLGLSFDHTLSNTTPTSPTAGRLGHGLLGAASLAHEESSGRRIHLDDSSPTSNTRLNNLSSAGHNTLTPTPHLLDPLTSSQPRSHRLSIFLRRTFYRLGFLCASYPLLVLIASCVIMGLLNGVGWKFFTIETSPVRLWVGPGSESRMQKEMFDEWFGPFYRVEQVFVTSAPSASTPSSPVLSYPHLKYWFDIEEEIRSLRSTPNGYTLDDVCFKPTEEACVVQSISAWLPDGYLDEDEWEERVLECSASPTSCIPEFGQPLQAVNVLGGIPNKADGSRDVLNSEAMVITYVVSDSLDPEVQGRAGEWERTLRAYLVELSKRITRETRSHEEELEQPEDTGLQIAWSTGVSLEEEINKSTNMDVRIVVGSYLAMFVYVAIALGNNSVSSSHRKQRSSSSLFSRIRALLGRSATGPTDTRSIHNTSGSVPLLSVSTLRSVVVNSKVLLGLFGIALVILSVSTSVAFFSLCGVRVTLIIAEVIPFLVLAVGVDNVFILVNELDRQNSLHGPAALVAYRSNSHPSSRYPSQYSIRPMSPTGSTRRYPSTDGDDEDTASMPILLTPEERVTRTLAKMGPSILLSTITETTAFLLGALVPMPAVKNFALYAGGSVLINGVLQVTVLVSGLVLDLRRTEANRVDCVPCLKLSGRIQLPPDSDDVQPQNSGQESSSPYLGNGYTPSAEGENMLTRFIRRHYAPWLLRSWVKAGILVVFGGIWILSIISIQSLKLGLDQRLALPSDSHLVDYFNAVDNLLEVGPPVYFVAHSVDATARSGQQALCGRFTTCEEFSVTNVLEVERKREKERTDPWDRSFIAEPTASWIDDFLGWLNPEQESCCRVLKSDPTVFCTPRDRGPKCQPCFKDRHPGWNITMRGMPEGEEFMRYLRQWLQSPTNEDCPLAGKASFGTALALSGSDASDLMTAQNSKGTVVASHFRTFHTPLRSQEDFIDSFEAAHRISGEIERFLKEAGHQISVFPYSLHYVFFDQYTHIISMTQTVLGLGLASVLVITSVLLGSLRVGFIVSGVVGGVVCVVLGVMSVWDVRLNAISLVNLSICLGIGVEFCVHVARAFVNPGGGYGVGSDSAWGGDHGQVYDTTELDREELEKNAQKERDERMWMALVDVGPSVLSGITFTKLIGMCVLGLTRSKLLEIYYFRTWLTLIISGALHGLVLLPVVLSWAGGMGIPLQGQEADEEWMVRVMHGEGGYEYQPFMADDDSSVRSD
ncbi:multidrug efflux transporter AcrB transmembrane domain-containing protein [Marasmius fiardii PR-910]|nr:multidrug efflux transporter AcrB transmembrane domain-containing protein [Marasmius fiardii PR-910]